MVAYDDLQAANDNSLNRDAAISLRLLHWFMESREEALAALMGAHYRPDPLRDELMRSICLFFAEGHIRALTEYQKDLEPRWDAEVVAQALDTLRAVHLVAVDGAPDGGIRPTMRLISFYNDTMPRVLDMAKRILRDGMQQDSLNQR